MHNLYFSWYQEYQQKGAPGDVRACLSSTPRPTWQARSLSTLRTFAFLPGHSLPLSRSVRRTIYKQLLVVVCMQ